VRGTQCAGIRLHPPCRFIPARAGNTATLAGAGHRQTVHPRACGEHDLMKSVADSSAGSSPRVRGTLQGRLSQPQKKRFIPARAGNTNASSGVDGYSAVHPRACGEHTISNILSAILDGSSPRVRGTPRGLHRIRQQFRFIPARAGNTPALAPEAAPEAVHPRACGEHAVSGRRPCESRGSSPRVRGTP